MTTGATRSSLDTSQAPSATDAKIDGWLMDRLSRLSPGQTEELLVHIHDARIDPAARPAPLAQRRKAVYDVLRLHALKTQAPLKSWLQARGIQARSFFLVDLLLLRGDLALARQIAARPEVREIVGNPVVFGLSGVRPGAPAAAKVGEAPMLATGASSDPIVLAPASTDSGPEWGIKAINADDVWATYGKHGEGIVVMSADTGVEWDHPAIKEKYRGWNGSSVSHAYNWHDAIQNLPEPLDDNDHGTHTTGTMVGDDGMGNQVGVAPGAKWIACRNMDHGNGQPSTYIDCMEWAMAPYPTGGDPALDGRPDLAPDAINNSWACPPSEGCSANTLKTAFENLLAAGILPVAANGNSGPACATTNDPPALYDSAFSAGAVDITITIATFSSRGPVTADGSGRRKPDVSAPGVDVRSSVRGGGYANFSGTSMASPHVTGGAALLWSVNPFFRPLLRITECLLEHSAQHVRNYWPQTCGGDSPNARPNNIWGWGLIDVLGAIQYGPDSDSDSVADKCDCAPLDGGAFDSPSEVTGVLFAADRQTLSWDSQGSTAGSGTSYDVARGRISQLRTDGNFSHASCLASSIPATAVTDADAPPSGDSFYYLSRARNTCGIGTYGSMSDGTVRSITACP